MDLGLKENYVYTRYEDIVAHTQARGCLIKLIRVSYAFQILSMIFSLLVTEIPNLEDSKYALMCIDGLSAMINGANSVILQIERQNRNKIESNTKVIAKIIDTMEDNTVTRDEFHEIIEIDKDKTGEIQILDLDFL